MTIEIRIRALNSLAGIRYWLTINGEQVGFSDEPFNEELLRASIARHVNSLVDKEIGEAKKSAT